MMTNEELWQSVLAQVQFDVSRANFATWFKNTKVVSNKEGEVLISVPNTFSKEWLSSKYQSLILKVLRSCDNNIRLISFSVESSSTCSPKARPQIQSDDSMDSQLQFLELKVNPITNLNPHYTFDNFVVGSFNELAHAASWAVSEKPGHVYNPLFIYGGVGLGKTHLLQATGNKLSKLSPNIKIAYTPAERLISKIIESIRNGEIENLKKKLCCLDVLIVDDVQFFAGKEKTQEEFFYIYNTLYQNQKQIILSSDRQPSAIPAITERLRSRFEGGMIADIGCPDVETKIAILKNKCDERQINLTDDILEFIAINIQKNIRELEGALSRLAMYQRINQKVPDILIAKKLLKNIVVAPQKSTTFKRIVQAVSSFYEISQDDILLPTRRKEIVKPRQVAMFLLRSELKESYPSIGRRFQGKDHTTAMYAFEKISQKMEEDQVIFNEINTIKQKIYSEL
ncbi:MAG: chromosomal replication initiator protein DnaA [bacterium]|nr:chromosomal replication initiator protein DnaA [bacterium]